MATATDNCDDTPDITWNDVTSQPDLDGPNRTITRTWTATDDCGNAASCDQVITVVDLTPPVISCGPDGEIDCLAEPEFDDPVVTDNCSETTVTCEVEYVRVDAFTEQWIQTCTAYDACRNGPAVCTQTITKYCPAEEFCTLTQGFYGGSGKWNDEPAIDLMERLLTEGGPMVIGVEFTRSVTFAAGDAACINERLPAGTTPMTLPEGFGDQVFDGDAATCDTPTPLPIYDGPRWMNVFLGQTVALAFNLRLDGNLGAWPIEPEFCTVPSLDGPGGECYLNGEEARMWTIPQSVFDYFTNNGYVMPTVDDLFELANKGLAGIDVSPATVADLNWAVDAINRGFDKCACLLPSCPDGMTAMVASFSLGGGTPSALTSGANEPALAGSNLPKEFELQQNYPNPFNPTTRIRVAVPQATSWTLNIYNVSGQLMQSFEGNTGGPTFVDVEWNGKDKHGQPVSTGVYFYRVKAGEFKAVKKMVLIK
jgi:hypothetical protein